MKSGARNQDGFTLIEILVAISIFAFGLLAIAGLQVSAIRYNAGSNYRTSTVAVTQGVMEEIMAMDGGSALFDIDQPTDVWINNADLPTGYSATWSSTINSPSGGVATVTVTVQGPQGIGMSLTSFKRIF